MIVINFTLINSIESKKIREYFDHIDKSSLNCSILFPSFEKVTN